MIISWRKVRNSTQKCAQAPATRQFSRTFKIARKWTKSRPFSSRCCGPCSRRTCRPHLLLSRCTKLPKVCPLVTIIKTARLSWTRTSQMRSSTPSCSLCSCNSRTRWTTLLTPRPPYSPSSRLRPCSSRNSRWPTRRRNCKRPIVSKTTKSKTPRDRVVWHSSKTLRIVSSPIRKVKPSYNKSNSCSSWVIWNSEICRASTLR